MIDLVVIVPLVAGLVSAIKKAGMPSRYAPVLSVMLGIAIVSMIPNHDVFTVLYNGILAGLSAAGLYSGGKAMLK